MAIEQLMTELEVSRLAKAAKTLVCQPTVDSICLALTELFPSINHGTKTEKDLVKELLEGECFLNGNLKDGVFRIVSVVSVEIQSPIDSDQWLCELRQEHNDGKVVERGLWGISEKIKGGEDAVDAAIRALKEELGIEVNSLSQLKYRGGEHKDNPKSAYLGIKSITGLHQFQYSPLVSEYCQEYREVQPKKVTVFGWRAK